MQLNLKIENLKSATVAHLEGYQFRYMYMLTLTTHK